MENPYHPLQTQQMGLVVEDTHTCALIPTLCLAHCLACRFDETVASFANAAGVGLGGDTLIGGAEGAPQVSKCREKGKNKQNEQ